jgi:hypothetical protein
MPYVYKVTFNDTNQYYIGSQYKRSSDPNDLGKKYFTSSPVVQNLLFEHGKQNVTFEVLSIVDTEKEARSIEAALIYECIEDSMCMNQKRGFNLTSGKIWITDGINEKRVYPHKMIDGYRIGRSDRQCARMKITTKQNYRPGQEKIPTEAVRGSVWINDGVISKRIKQTNDIPSGFVKGRLGKK